MPHVASGADGRVENDRAEHFENAAVVGANARALATRREADSSQNLENEFLSIITKDDADRCLPLGLHMRFSGDGASELKTKTDKSMIIGCLLFARIFVLYARFCVIDL